MLQYAMSYRGALSHTVRDRAVSSQTDMSRDRQTGPHHAVPCRAAPYSTEPDIQTGPNRTRLSGTKRAIIKAKGQAGLLAGTGHTIVTAEG